MSRMVVMGLGITGRAVTTALLKRDIDVVALDDRITDELRDWVAAAGLEVKASTDLDLVRLLRCSDGVLPAPGLPEHHAIFAAAAEAGVPVLSEFDLAARWDDRPTVAVTGTDGKTTVVTLIERMLQASGVAATTVGNTDTPWVEAIDDPDPQVFVVEASSFRLGHSQKFSPRVAAWLNFGPDHLDAHHDLGAYEAAKASIWRDLDSAALAVANRDDVVVAAHAASLTGKVQTFGADAPPSPSDHGVVDGSLIVAGDALVAIDELSRSMPHDIMNGLAAAACALQMGAQREVVAAVLREFDGLEHRVELIADIDGVRYVNDSKATTPHAAAAALGGFDSIVLLAGGKNKGLSFDDMLEHIDNIVHVVALGDAAPDIEAVFGPHTDTSRATSMEQAVQLAADVARSGDVVLLSPACASYDWYQSYVHRGQDFARIVRARIAS